MSTLNEIYKIFPCNIIHEACAMTVFVGTLLSCPKIKEIENNTNEE